MRTENSKENLCDTCVNRSDFPNCLPEFGDEIKYGDGVGNDNIIECPAYKLLKKIVSYLKKQFTVEKILDRYGDRLVEIILDKVVSAVNDQQKGRLAAADIQISHEAVVGGSHHVFIIKLTMDREKLIAILRNK